MVTPVKPSIPIELMDILHSIKDDISDVKDDVVDVRERVIRLEAHNHEDSLKTIWVELEKEREKRIKLEIDLASIKTKLAPIIIGISIAGAALIEAIVKSVH